MARPADDRLTPDAPLANVPFLPITWKSPILGFLLCKSPKPRNIVVSGVCAHMFPYRRIGVLEPGEGCQGTRSDGAAALARALGVTVDELLREGDG